MISYCYLGDENLTKLATFLDASKGRGREVAPAPAGAVP